jgi:putative inorganic carbon (HCO3(-)) transporter
LFDLVLISSCVLSALAMNDYRHGRLMLGVRIQGAIGGLFDNPNDLALHLVTMIPIAIGMLFSTRGAKKLFFAISAVLMVAGVVVTFSRGGFLGMAVAGGVLTWRIARRNRWMVAIVLPIILLLFVMLAPGGYGTRLSLTTDESASTRTDELKRSIFIASRHPLLGVGMDNYILYSNTDHASHNAYTQVASELGIGAMIIYLLFQVLPLRELRRISRETFLSRRSSHFYYLAIGLEASLVGYMVSSFFGSVAFLWYGYYIVGYSVCFKRLYTASGENSPIP